MIVGHRGNGAGLDELRKHDRSDPSAARTAEARREARTGKRFLSAAGARALSAGAVRFIKGDDEHAIGQGCGRRLDEWHPVGEELIDGFWPPGASIDAVHIVAVVTEVWGDEAVVRGGGGVGEI